MQMIFIVIIFAIIVVFIARGYAFSPLHTRSLTFSCFRSFSLHFSLFYLFRSSLDSRYICLFFHYRFTVIPTFYCTAHILLAGHRATLMRYDLPTIKINRLYLHCLYARSYQFRVHNFDFFYCIVTIIIA